MNDLDKKEWIPNWRDGHGVVHIMGTHTNRRALTECGIEVVQRGDGREWMNYYESIRDAPTCIVCIVRDTEGNTPESVIADFIRKKMDEPTFASQFLKPLDDDD